MPPAVPVTADPATAAATSRPLDAIDTWVFDLDNTLYPPACNLFMQIDIRMSQFIARLFDLPIEEARRLQKRYFRTHGTTLRGLMLEHTIEPTAFLDFVHDIDLSPVPASPALDEALARLPGRKLVFTNGTRRHAEKVMDRLGVAQHFTAIFDIVASGYVPKPEPEPYATLVRRFGFNPQRACMVDDIARNLAPAHALGMVTAWMRSDSAWGRPDLVDRLSIDHEIDDLADWLGRIPDRAGGADGTGGAGDA